jgi:hypothetical protein
MARLPIARAVPTPARSQLADGTLGLALAVLGEAQLVAAGAASAQASAGALVLLAKLGVRDRVQAGVLAYESGLAYRWEEDG